MIRTAILDDKIQVREAFKAADYNASVLQKYVMSLAVSSATTRKPTSAILELKFADCSITITPVDSDDFVILYDNDQTITAESHYVCDRVMAIINRVDFGDGDGLVRLSIIRNDGGPMMNGRLSLDCTYELVKLFIKGARYQTELIPVSQHAMARHPDAIRMQVGQKVVKHSILTKKLRLSPSFKVAWMPHLKLRCCEKTGAWGLIKDGYVCWLMSNAADVGTLFDLVSVDDASLSGVPIWVNGELITWKGEFDCVSWDENYEYDLSVVPAIVCEDFANYGGVRPVHLADIFRLAISDVELVSHQERREDKTVYTPLERLRMAAVYRLYHTLLRMVHASWNNTGDNLRLKVTVECNDSPVVLKLKPTYSRVTVDQVWRAECLIRDQLVREPIEGHLKELCEWALQLEDLENQSEDWAKWFDTVAGQLHLTVKFNGDRYEL